MRSGSAAVEKTGGRYYVAKNEASLLAAVDDIDREAAGAISARQYTSQQPRFTLFALAAFTFWTGAAGLKVGTPWFGRIHENRSFIRMFIAALLGDAAWLSWSESRLAMRVAEAKQDIATLNHDTSMR